MSNGVQNNGEIAPKAAAFSPGDEGGNESKSHPERKDRDYRGNSRCWPR